jgi:uncharacterized protein YciI
VPQFLYRVVPTRLAMLTEGPTERESSIVREHFQYLARLVEEGVVFVVGRTQTNDEKTFGIAIFEAQDEAAARALMEDDPAVKHGVMRAELFPYRIALWSKRGPTP